MIYDSDSRDEDGDYVGPDVCRLAQSYIKAGYQPYGQVLINNSESFGIRHVEHHLAMVKYR